FENNMLCWDMLNGNRIAMAPEGNQAFCSVLYPGKYFCIGDLNFVSNKNEATTPCK
uniref:Uncharacterized protein n=1 Tax=Cairina moschata TaxID=8855 RepID=A0A8C3GRB3_CAIMO